MCIVLGELQKQQKAIGVKICDFLCQFYISIKCLWRDDDMQRIIDESEILVTDYLRRRKRLLTIG